MKKSIPKPRFAYSRHVFRQSVTKQWRSSLVFIYSSHICSNLFKNQNLNVFDSWPKTFTFGKIFKKKDKIAKKLTFIDEYFKNSNFFLLIETQ